MFGESNANIREQKSDNAWFISILVNYIVLSKDTIYSQQVCKDDEAAPVMILPYSLGLHIML